MSTNKLLLRTINGEKVDRPPIWLMRQAGRILPEYREVRASVENFVALVRNPELAAEVTVQPVDILGVDAAILFSDILVIPEAMGLPYKLVEKKGPIFPRTIESETDIENLIQGQKAAEELDYVYEAIKVTKKKLAGRVPLIGFAGAPWTLFSYMIEGQGSKTFSKAKKMLYQSPRASHQLLDKITESIIHYLKNKIAAGVDVVQVFDSWAGLLNADLYNVYAIPYLRRIVNAINEVPVIVFSRGAYFSMEELIDLNSNVVGLDWTMDPTRFRSQFGQEVIVQGNMDPCVLYGSMDLITSKARSIINALGGQHIFNLGHGVYPDTDPAKVKELIDYVKSYRYKRNKKISQGVDNE
ncbi:MAG: uroporphyrinogen decarboxylase [Saprospiraceae bacterium]|nr:uroporphyrinogen decarboxylase [Saprospiraceae bacterium]